MTSWADRNTNAARLLAELRSRPVEPAPARSVYWRPAPDEYAVQLRDAVLEAEEFDDGESRFSAGFATGLRLAAGLYGMPEGVDPVTRKRMADEYAGGWFGSSWDAPVCDPETFRPTPVGEQCAACPHQIEDGDAGMIIPHTYAPGAWRLTATHLACFRRGLGQVIGRLEAGQ